MFSQLPEIYCPILSGPGNTLYTLYSYCRMRPAMARERPGHPAVATNPLFDTHVMRSAVNPGAGETACTGSDGNSPLPNASRITSDDIRFNDVTNCPNTCRFDVMRPASCWSCRAVVTVSGLASTVVPPRAPQRTPRNGDGAPSALSYDVILYGHPGRPSDISGTTPVSDVPPYTSKGPSRDKSSNAGTTSAPESGCDSPTTEIQLSPRAVSEVIRQM